MRYLSMVSFLFKHSQTQFATLPDLLHNVGRLHQKASFLSQLTDEMEFATP